MLYSKMLNLTHHPIKKKTSWPCISKTNDATKNTFK
jgi:hypothetical protein